MCIVDLIERPGLACAWFAETAEVDVGQLEGGSGAPRRQSWLGEVVRAADRVASKYNRLVVDLYSAVAVQIQRDAVVDVLSERWIFLCDVRWPLPKLGEEWSTGPFDTPDLALAARAGCHCQILTEMA